MKLKALLILIEGKVVSVNISLLIAAVDLRPEGSKQPS